AAPRPHDVAGATCADCEYERGPPRASACRHAATISSARYTPQAPARRWRPLHWYMLVHAGDRRRSTAGASRPCSPRLGGTRSCTLAGLGFPRASWACPRRRRRLRRLVGVGDDLPAEAVVDVRELDPHVPEARPAPEGEERLRKRLHEPVSHILRLDDEVHAFVRPHRCKNLSLGPERAPIDVRHL